MDLSLASNKATNVIQSDSLSLTRYAGVGAAVLVVLNSINPAADKLLGSNPSSTDRVAFYIAVIASWAVIAAMDIFSRAYATAHAKAPVGGPPGGGTDGASTVIALAPAHAATVVTGGAQPGFVAVAVRIQSDQTTDFLLIKPGQSPLWVAAADVQLT